MKLRSIQRFLILLAILLALHLSAQVHNEPPYVFSVTQLKGWTAAGPMADERLVSRVPLAQRFMNTATQINPQGSNAMKIVYLPGGMNNLGNYAAQLEQFNAYTFTNWAYIDTLVWFGGTSDHTVQLPAAPWVEAAHKSGVRVLGNIFFAPKVFGGEEQTLDRFLAQNEEGDFIVIPILVGMMEYYGFDGWFINQETDVSREIAQRMRSFLGDFTAAVEAVGKEVMWYDAMLPSGEVVWQNTLNSLNSPFLQDDTTVVLDKQKEKRVSSSMFINFSWDSSRLPRQSRNRAHELKRSAYEVFTGVDLWPDRNQLPFDTGGNHWMELLHDVQGRPYTSLGLFAASCVFDNPRYSDFATDPTDYARFYRAERALFAGADENAVLQDTIGFKGLSHWVPAASVIKGSTFHTSFNLGHGERWFERGAEVRSTPWHNMRMQDVLPTWQFAFTKDGLKGFWDVKNAYEGGSSLGIVGEVPPHTPVDLAMYKTDLSVSENSEMVLRYWMAAKTDVEVRLVITFEDSRQVPAEFRLQLKDAEMWSEDRFRLTNYAGQRIAKIGMRFLSSDAIARIDMRLGQLRVDEE